ncbi:translocon component PTEX88 [Plasmodium gonderi]|uniref:Translocon component PTEX88 n=1 Tax=Plasmodium gonderi TaxID=77519 RepID=A0A1Y1JLB6_PLAGO|nr:translocon component PTEX88 [Plasmodium gonderi]GAW80834.1 translocon component PTEX88 [Plasmodium gonderi]
MKRTTPLLLLLLIGLILPSVWSANEYSIKHTGELILTNHINSLVNVRVVPHEETFSLELNNIIKFPVHCIPHSAVDYNVDRKKKPLYFVKHEFKNSIHLYKNNVNLMALNFPDRYYIVGIAANNGSILMITDVDIYKIDVKKKKISILNVLSEKYANIMNNKEMFFTGLIADSVKNQFFIICAIKQNYLILHVKHDETNDYIEIINVIDTVNGKHLRVLNGIAIVNDHLYITENAESVLRLTLNRTNNSSVQTKKMYSFSNGDKIVGLSVNAFPDPEDKKLIRDYLIVNTKHVSNDKPSSEGRMYLMSIKGKNDSVDVYTILDLYSKDLNPLYFTIYDAHIISEEEEYEKGSLTKELNNNKAKYLNLNSATTGNVNIDEELDEAEKKQQEEDNKYKIKIIWTNNYNCTVNKGVIDIRNIKNSSNKELKIPFVDITNQYALAPHVTSASTCSGKEKLFKQMCYYDSVNNYVSILNKLEEYNEHYSGNFLFDGLKNFIAFDYKSLMNVHVLTYPLNNTVYVHMDKDNLTINLPKPFGISMDLYNSTENSVIFYITGSDDAQNYVNKCVIKKMEKTYECYNIYRKKNESNEYFQHISFITYEENNNNNNNNSSNNNNKLSYIYVTNNKTNIYRLTKHNEKWNFEEWLNLDEPHQRVGPITTSINYFFVKQNVLENFVRKYPQSKLLANFQNPKEEDLHITEDGYIFLATSHTIVFVSNNDSYGEESASSIHFYTSVLKEKYYQSFSMGSIVLNIENSSKFSYYLDQ